MNRVVIDARTAGISGDMLLAALVDVGANETRVSDVVEAIPKFFGKCRALSVKFEEVKRKGFRAKQTVYSIEESERETHGDELADALARSCENGGLSKAAAEFAISSLNELISVEARLHGSSRKAVHLHEAGSADSLADILGTSVALDDLDFFSDTEFACTPVAVGGGSFRFSHGIVSSPAPAVMEMLAAKKIPVVGGPTQAELATPTGVAMLTKLVSSAGNFYPEIIPDRVGYGAGSKDFDDFPNILRVVKGANHGVNYLHDEVHVLETNLDDVSGETLGDAVNQLMRLGAKDVSVIPVFSKKNRPAHILQVLASEDSIETLTDAIVDLTGTLGVREYVCRRRILNREIVPVEIEIKGERFELGVKVASDRNGRIVRVKPEFDEAQTIASKLAVSVRFVMEEAEKVAREKIRR